jgi:hypothetical protein
MITEAPASGIPPLPVIRPVIVLAERWPDIIPARVSSANIETKIFFILSPDIQSLNTTVSEEKMSEQAGNDYSLSLRRYYPDQVLRV